MLKIGVYGGSFDPVHKDHIAICECFANALSLDEVLVVPTKLSPFKSSSGASGIHRLNMLKIACKNNKKLKPCSIELELEGKSYTYRTIQVLRERYPTAKMYFLLGADSLRSFPNWLNPDKIVEQCEIVVAGRLGEDMQGAINAFEERFNKKPIALEVLGSIASSYVRELLNLDVNCDKYLPSGVYEYIKQNSLYCGDRFCEYLKNNLKTERLKHVGGVAYLSAYYTKKIGESADKAHIAGLLHDVAKYKNYKNYPEFCFLDGFDEKAYPQIIHQFLGAHVAEKELGITDEEVLDAIRWHTTGCANMTNLQKIVFVADLLEPSRNYEEVDFLRGECEKDFERGFRLCVKRLIAYLERSGQAVHHYTLQANKFYNE